MNRFIMNPAARSWNGQKDWVKIEKELKEADYPYAVRFTEGSKHAITLGKELTEPEMDTTLLGILGGDGTLNEVVNGLPEGPLPDVFYVPCGSGNDFARGSALKVTADNAVSLLTAPGALEPKRVDISDMLLDGKAPKRFVVSSGIGFDAAVCWDMLHSKVKAAMNKLHLGKLSYLILGLKNIFGCPLTDGTLTVDDGKKVLQLRKIAFISAHNLPYEGGGFYFAPKAVPMDGKLDLCVVTAGNHLRFLIVLAASVFKGSHIKMKGVHYIQCSKAELKLKAPLYLHTDGEVSEAVDHVVWKTGDFYMNVLQ